MLQKAEGAKMAVVREVSGGPTFPPYDYVGPFSRYLSTASVTSEINSTC